MPRKNLVHRLVTGLGFALLAAGIGAGCGGRAAQPVASTTPMDATLSCDHLRAERQVNLARIADLGGERHDANRDVARLVMDPLVIDLSQTEQREIAALEARNQELDRLIAGRCPAS